VRPLRQPPIPPPTSAFPSYFPPPRLALQVHAPPLATAWGAALVVGAAYGPGFACVAASAGLGLFANRADPVFWRTAGGQDTGVFILSLIGARVRQPACVCVCAFVNEHVRGS
jgi:hypothetical protein